MIVGQNSLYGKQKSGKEEKKTVYPHHSNTLGFVESSNIPKATINRHHRHSFVSSSSPTDLTRLKPKQDIVSKTLL